MTVQFRRIARLPIRLTLLYVGATAFVFAFGPFDWPVDNWAILIAFMIAVMVALWFGFRIALALPAGSAAPIRWKWILLVGTITSVVVLFVVAPVYTGRMPWQMIGALQDQGAAYASFQNQLELTAGSRGPLALLRILTWPLVFAVIPLGMLHWPRLNARWRALIPLTLASMVVFSILRGTDRESADILAIVGSTAAVVIARSIVHDGWTCGMTLRRYRSVTLVCCALLIIAGVLFLQRKMERTLQFGSLSAVCVGQNEQGRGGICADFDYPLFERLGLNDTYRFALSMAVAYFSQGYYGLSLALDLPDFKSTLGLGNARFAMAAYVDLTGDFTLYENSYTHRMSEAGWNDDHQWSTMFPWLANDISFPAVPLFMILIGAGFGAAWRDAVFGRNDFAAIVLPIFSIMMVYLPATNQITIGPDYPFALLVWGVLWRRGRQPLPCMLSERKLQSV
jgi:hypothetical protein